MSPAPRPCRLRLSAAIDRYIATDIRHKKTAAREILALRQFQRANPDLVAKPLARVNKRDVATWRDRRLGQVSGATVRREWSILSALFTCASKVWGLELPANPFHQVRRPPGNKPRRQRISPAQCQMFLEALDYRGQVLQSRHKVAWSFLFALETACRKGEILRLRPEDVHDGVLVLGESKNGDGRIVPLSPLARRLLGQVQLPLGLSAQSFDALFRRHRPPPLTHIHFHDTRHEALSRMARKIANPMTLAKISGHRDLKILLNTYYNPSEEDFAGLLD